MWKEIDGFKDYLISEQGEVLSKKSNKILKQSKRNGYLSVALYSEKYKNKSMTVHRIVAQSFIQNTDNKPQVNHIDGNKLNNCIDNLEWCTSKENNIHAYENKLNTYTDKEKLKEMAIKSAKKTSKRVIQIDKNTIEIINVFESLTDASRITGIDIKNISKCVNNKCKTSGGFIWKLFQEVTIESI